MPNIVSRDRKAIVLNRAILTDEEGVDCCECEPPSDCYYVFLVCGTNETVYAIVDCDDPFPYEEQRVYIVGGAGCAQYIEFTDELPPNGRRVNRPPLEPNFVNCAVPECECQCPRYNVALSLDIHDDRFCDLSYAGVLVRTQLFSDTCEWTNWDEAGCVEPPRFPDIDSNFEWECVCDGPLCDSPLVQMRTFFDPFIGSLVTQVVVLWRDPDSPTWPNALASPAGAIIDEGLCPLDGQMDVASSLIMLICPSGSVETQISVTGTVTIAAI